MISVEDKGSPKQTEEKIDKLIVRYGGKKPEERGDDKDGE